MKAASLYAARDAKPNASHPTPCRSRASRMAHTLREDPISPVIAAQGKAKRRASASQLTKCERLTEEPGRFAAPSRNQRQAVTMQPVM